MSHSKYRARGQSYYFDKVNKEAAAKYIKACSVCGQRGFDPAVVELEPNKYLVAELQHMYKPLVLNAAGICKECVRGA